MATKAEKTPDAVKYTVTELTEAKGVFSTTKDVVKTALKLDGKELYTVDEAKAIVKKFSEKKIK